MNITNYCDVTNEIVNILVAIYMDFGKYVEGKRWYLVGVWTDVLSETKCIPEDLIKATKELCITCKKVPTLAEIIQKEREMNTQAQTAGANCPFIS